MRRLVHCAWGQVCEAIRVATSARGRAGFLRSKTIFLRKRIKRHCRGRMTGSYPELSTLREWVPSRRKGPIATMEATRHVGKSAVGAREMIHTIRRSRPFLCIHELGAVAAEIRNCATFLPKADGSLHEILIFLSFELTC